MGTTKQDRKYQIKDVAKDAPDPVKPKPVKKWKVLIDRANFLPVEPFDTYDAADAAGKKAAGDVARYDVVGVWV